jgi:hypothetical protein
MAFSPQRFSLWFGNVSIAFIAIALLITILSLASDIIAGRHATPGIYVTPVSETALAVRAFRFQDEGKFELRSDDLIVGIGNERFGVKRMLPRSQLEFRYAFIEAGGQVLVLRGQEIVSVPAPINYRPAGWLSFFSTMVFFLLGLMIAFFGKPKYGTRRAAAIVLLHGFVAGLGASSGPSVVTLTINVAASSVMGFCIIPLLINWIQRLYYQTGHYLAMAAPWVLSVFGISVYSLYFGGPVPPNLINPLFAMLLGLNFVCWLGMMIYVHPRLEFRQRQQLNWVVAALAVQIICLALSIALIWMTGNEYFLYAGLLSVTALAIGFGMAVLRSDFGNIDRAVSLTLTYALLAVSLALLIEFVVEPLAGVGAAYFGFPETAGQTVLIVAIALGAPALKSALQPKLDSYFLKQAGKTESRH